MPSRKIGDPPPTIAFFFPSAPTSPSQPQPSHRTLQLRANSRWRLHGLRFLVQPRCRNRNRGSAIEAVYNEAVLSLQEHVGPEGSVACGGERRRGL